MKYDVGQYVMYRNNGVCRIEAIGKLGFLQNSDEDYYTLRPPFTTSDEHSYVPTKEEEYLRSVITRQEAYTYLDRLNQLEVSPSGIKKRQELVSYYHELLSAEGLNGRLRLLKELSLKEQTEQNRGKRLTTTDEQYKRKTEQLLSEEFAVALEESPEQAKEQLYAAMFGAK